MRKIQKKWETIVNELKQLQTRYMVRREKKTPWLQIFDKQERKQFSLKPIAGWDNMPEINKVADFIAELENQPWPDIPAKNLIEIIDNPDQAFFECKYDWDKVQLLTLQHMLNKNKGIDSNVKGDLNRLVKLNPPFRWPAIKSWVYEKKLESNMFRVRIDSLAQIRIALTNQFGEEPEWLKEADIKKIRGLHKLAFKKENEFISNDSSVRGIPTKEQLEEYLHSLDKKFRLEKFCIACQVNYGLRNHEIFHSSIIKKTNLEEGLYEGHLYVPGKWRTKSFEHFVWPLYPSWIEEFNLIKDFEAMQERLRARVKMNIVSAFDKQKEWREGNPQDRGVCINNRTLGSWLTKRMKKYLPPLVGSVPDADGLPNQEYKEQRITPYDFRHTWAVRMATDERCKGITDEQAAKAMGHSLEVHQRIYQKWVSKTEARKLYMNQINFPSDI